MLVAVETTRNHLPPCGIVEIGTLSDIQLTPFIQSGARVNRLIAGILPHCWDSIQDENSAEKGGRGKLAKLAIHHLRW